MVRGASGGAESSARGAAGAEAGVSADSVAGVGSAVGGEHVVEVGGGFGQHEIVAVAARVIFGDAVSLRDGDELLAARVDKIGVDGEVGIDEYEIAIGGGAVAEYGRGGRSGWLFGRVGSRWL